MRVTPPMQAPWCTGRGPACSADAKTAPSNSLSIDSCVVAGMSRPDPHG